jgi:hypothetical protein
MIMAMIKIGFDESSKAVTAHVQIEKDIDTTEQEQQLMEQTTKMMDEAMRYAQRKTMQLKG